MGTGRGRAALSCGLLALALTLFIAGCGSEDHPNEPRPPVAVEVSASLSENRLSIQPQNLGFGESDQPMTQNENQPQEALSSDRPLTVSFTVSNLTDYDTSLQFEGPTSEESEPITAQGVGSFKLELPTGDYFVVATGVPGTPQTNLSVGPERPSSQNDLLLP